MVALKVTANCHIAQAHGVAAIETEREAFAAEAVELVERTALDWADDTKTGLVAYLRVI